MIVDTAWDIASIGMDIYSLKNSIACGSGWDVALDAGALALDIAAVALPFVPAVGAALVKGSRIKKLQPVLDAVGPHSTFKLDELGRVKHHAEWVPNSRNPLGWDQAKRVDTQYANPHSHGGVSTPHAHDSGGVRPANPSELPR